MGTICLQNSVSSEEWLILFCTKIPRMLWCFCIRHATSPTAHCTASIGKPFGQVIPWHQSTGHPDYERISSWYGRTLEAGQTEAEWGLSFTSSLSFACPFHAVYWREGSWVTEASRVNFRKLIHLQTGMQGQVSPKYKGKVWSLSLDWLQEMGLNPIAMATRDFSDQQAFRSTGAKTVLFSKEKTYLCFPFFAL